jgi:CubicO group peptidase (beta-lactamase class C family)
MNPPRTLVLLLAALLPAGAARAAGADARTLDAEVTKALAAWRVPGAAVVVVRDGRVVYLAGHGVRAAGKKAPVTPDTVFPLASCSKAFTTAAMAALVDAKKLRWDDRVRQHLPWFRLSDPLADRDVRLRDLVCHRTGVASHDALWYRAPWKPEETVRRLAHLPLAEPFRTAVQYQSTMFTAAGLAAAAADGRPWPRMIQERLLGPLAMKSTTLDTAAALLAADVAAGHRPDGAGDPEAMPLYRIDADPAGSVHSTARDLAKWLDFQLTGAAGGKRLVSAAALEETHAAQMVMRLTPEQRLLFPDTVQHSYAMGWVVYDDRGLRVLAHGGAIDGFRAQIVLVPAKNLGVAVLSNMHQTWMNLALADVLLDHLLGRPRRDWHALHHKVRRLVADAAAERERRRLAGRRHGTTPSHGLAAYAGRYEHPAYGTAVVALRRGRLVWSWRGDESPLTHFHLDTFTTQGELTGEAELAFGLDSAGNVERVRVTGRLGVEFRRAAKK